MPGQREPNRPMTSPDDEQLREAAVLVRKREYRRALDIYRRIPGPDADYGAGGCLHKLKRYDEAKVAFSRCLRQCPDHPQARRLLQHVERRLAKEAPAGAPAADKPKPEEVTFDGLAESPERYEGRNVKVEGYLQLGPEGPRVRERRNAGRTVELEVRNQIRGGLIEFLLFRFMLNFTAKFPGQFTCQGKRERASLGVLRIDASRRRRAAAEASAASESDNTSGVQATAAAIVVTNLLPLAGAIFLGWDLGAVMTLYRAELAVVGALGAIAMVVQPLGANESLVSGAFAVLFRIVFAGIFCAVFFCFCGANGMMVLGMFASEKAAELQETGLPSFITEGPPDSPVVFIGMTAVVFVALMRTMGPWFVIALVCMGLQRGGALIREMYLREKGQSNAPRCIWALKILGRNVLFFMGLIFCGILLSALQIQFLVLVLAVAGKTAFRLAMLPRWTPYGYAPRPVGPGAGQSKQEPRDG